jgi:hypothetical protein
MKTAAARLAKHTEHALGKRENGVLYSALRKYRPENFQVKTLVIANDWEYLCDLERKVIKAFGTRHPLGYNMTDGGEGVQGKRDEAARLKISLAQKKRFQDPAQRALAKASGAKGGEARAKICAANRVDGKALWQLNRKSSGKKRMKIGSPEHRLALRIAAEQRLADSRIPIRHKISVGTKAAMARPEVAAKVKRCAQERAANPAWRAKISASKTGKKIGPCSADRKAKIAAARRREWADPVIRQRRLAALAIARAARTAKSENQ